MMGEQNAVQYPSHAIAVIGMAGRFPGARSIGEFWRNLRDGVESIAFFTDEELRAAGVPQSHLDDPTYVRAAGIVEGIEDFDASFFGYSPYEAAVTDPQQRLLLECSWHALEMAGYAPDSCTVPVGVYMGVDISTYLFNNLYPIFRRGGEANTLRIALPNASDSAATRISYRLNLTGPSLSVQTACSTSLVAIHIACLALQNYECDLALAGGAFIPVPQRVGYHYEEGGHLSPDGHVRAFDASAKGTVNGSGAGAVLLKRLEEAIEDGDTIHAIVLGSALNNDGSQKVGFTAPSIDGQAEVIEAAHAAADVPPDSITYIETHGTGTRLGDPIEVAALTRAFRTATDHKEFCAIGSVKTNIGHASSAAGVAGFIKVCLALEHGLIPPSLHFKEPNPEIDFENSPFFVNTKLTEWRCDGPRRAGISSFGLGGTNAHVVLEEPPPVDRSGITSKSARSHHIFILSAGTRAALDAATAQLAAHLREDPDLDPADTAYTLQVGRSAFAHRRIVVSDGIKDAAAAFEGPDPERVLSGHAEGGDRPVAFMFPGGGSQYAGMGHDLYFRERIYAENVDRCAEIVRKHLSFDIREFLYPAVKNGDKAAKDIPPTTVALPSIFATTYALAHLLMAWGIRPQALLGHSLGEYVAACLAGVMSLEDTLALTALRARLIDTLPGGAMLSVPLSEAEIIPLLGDDLSIAAVNSPTSCVVSGSTAAVESFEAMLLGREIDIRRLRVNAAGHSALFEPLMDEIAQFTRGMTLHPPTIPYISNLSGTWITPEEATDHTYWARHLRHTVRFAEGVAALVAEPARILLQVGPGNTLCSLARQHPDITRDHLILSTMRHRDEETADDRFLLGAVGRLWLAGTEIDWDAYRSGERRRRVELPPYPFERKRCWVEPSEAAPAIDSAVRSDIGEWFYLPAWRRTMPPPAPAGIGGDPPPSAHPVPECWMIFEDSFGIADACAARLKNENHTVVRVSPGARYEKAGEDRFTIDPEKEEDYRRLASDLRSDNLAPRRIVHMWSLTEGGTERSGGEDFDACQITGFHSVCRIGRIIPELVVAEPLHIDIVTNGLYDVTGRETVMPGKATIAGPARTIPLEYPNVTCRLIDLPLYMNENGGATTDIAALLHAELSHTTADRSVAYRGDGRWVDSFEPVTLPEAPEDGTALKDGGTYLITAGLGGVGFELARFIARRVSCRLVLPGRTEIPPRDTWDTPAAEDDKPADTPLRERIAKVLELEALGAEVVTSHADVSDRPRMEKIIGDIQNRFGRIDGVIHAAAAKTSGAIDVLTEETMEKEFASKIRGAYVLDSLLGDAGIDFFMLCSSINAFAPVPGLTAYAAANAFLDSFARDRNATGGARWISINWPRWKGVGSVERHRRSADEPIDEAGMTAEQGVNAFGRILHACTVPHVVVSPERIEFYLRVNLDGAAAATGRNRGPRPLVSTHARPDLATEYVAPRNDTERRIAGIWSELLGIGEVGVFDGFFELGGNSLIATQVMSRIREIFKTAVSVRALFDTPTVAGLAARILERKASAIDPAALDAMVSEIRSLSDEDIKQILEAESKEPSGEKPPKEKDGND